jgi:SAM-dependent methyltransferase
MNNFNKLVAKIKHYGLRDVVRNNIPKILYRYKKNSVDTLKLFTGDGLEIGGPSKFFSKYGIFPIYEYAKKIDNINFSADTIWEGSITEGKVFKYSNSKEAGFQYVDEGSSLSKINKKYDFILSCHCLEHIANPLKAIKGWINILNPNGILCLVLPDKKFTFDRNRPYTTFIHLLEDERRGVSEEDTTHFEEILNLHDRALDFDYNQSTFEAWIRDNSINRGVHHHVFNEELIIEILGYCNFRIVHFDCIRPNHILAVAISKK